ncbi:helicase [Alkalihalobacterium sp. APHAB7]|uniref:helicase n=1 Tax=Alkalihalobacterium sp. APHAB7 TaxID=3402081 RepID=UPI003AAEDD31
MGIYPDCPMITRTIEVGGLTKSQLYAKMQQYSILMNEYGDRLFSDERFPTSNTKYRLKTVELTVMDLGFPDGGTTDQVFKRASELGLDLCPLELGPYLRLEYMDQPESCSVSPSQQHQAPTGSITIASEIIAEEDEFPKGFYLRRMKGELWLRGYIADHLHVWNPDDHFIFCLTKKT